MNKNAEDSYARLILHPSYTAFRLSALRRLPRHTDAAMLADSETYYGRFIQEAFLRVYDDPRRVLSDTERDASWLSALLEGDPNLELQAAVKYAQLLAEMARYGVKPEDLPESAPATNPTWVRVKKSWSKVFGENLDFARREWWLIEKLEAEIKARQKNRKRRKTGNSSESTESFAVHLRKCFPDILEFRLNTSETRPGPERLLELMENIGVDVQIRKNPPTPAPANTALGILQHFSPPRGADEIQSPSSLPKAPEDDTLRVLYASGVEREALEQLATARRLLEEKHLRECDLLLAVPNLESYRVPLEHAGRRLGLKLAFRRGRSAGAHPAVSWVFSLLALAEPPAMLLCEDLVALLASPWCRLNNGSVSALTTARILQELRYSHVRETTSEKDFEELGAEMLRYVKDTVVSKESLLREAEESSGKNPAESAWVNEIIEKVERESSSRLVGVPETLESAAGLLQTLFEGLRSITRSPTLGEAASALMNFLTGEDGNGGAWNFPDCSDFGETRWARNAVLESIDSLAFETLELTPDTAAETLAEFLRFSLQGKAYMGNEGAGIPVLPAREAVGVECDYLFIFGMDSSFASEHAPDLPLSVRTQINMSLKSRGRKPLPTDREMRLASFENIRALIGSPGKGLYVSFPFTPLDREKNNENAPFVFIVQHAFAPRIHENDPEQAFNDILPLEAFLAEKQHVTATIRREPAEKQPAVMADPNLLLAGGMGRASDVKHRIAALLSREEATKIIYDNSGNPQDIVTEFAAASGLNPKRKYQSKLYGYSGILDERTRRRVFKKLEKTVNGKTIPYLSPSSWSSWCNNPLGYLYECIGLGGIEEPDEWLPAMLRGTTVHFLLQKAIEKFPPRKSLKGLDNYLNKVRSAMRPPVRALLKAAEKTRLVGQHYNRELDVLRMLNMLEAAVLQEVIMRRPPADKKSPPHAGVFAPGNFSEKDILSEISLKGELPVPFGSGIFNVYLYGRADRLAFKDKRMCVLDYKTGKQAYEKGIANGQAVFYALLQLKEAGLLDENGFPPADIESVVGYLYLGAYPGRQQRHSGEDMLDPDKLLQEASGCFTSGTKIGRNNMTLSDFAGELLDMAGAFAACHHAGIWPQTGEL